jgi:hypothetical protein
VGDCSGAIVRAALATPNRQIGRSNRSPWHILDGCGVLVGGAGTLPRGLLGCGWGDRSLLVQVDRSLPGRDQGF